jgi:N-carbamoyl-L-amino-acid hydrolase
MVSSTLRINPERFRKNFEELSQIGTTGNGGVNRPTFSPAHFNAREWFKKQAATANLSFKTDGAGNHSAILNCGTPNAPTFLLGSHLDSVPYGGRFDGALGVMAAVEVLQTIKEAGLRLPFHLEAIDFTDEEGTLVGLLGSSAIAGKITRNELRDPRGGRQNFLDSIKKAGLTEESICNAQRETLSLAGYLELHIEQGARLQEENADMGVVTTIVGIGSYKITFIGVANHAGTTSMASRLDAALGASAFTLAVRNLVIKKYPGCVANVGNMNFLPGVFNIIPERVVVSLEFRAPQITLLDQLETAILSLAQEQAKLFDLTLEIESLGKHAPASMDINVQNVCKQAALTLGLNALQMPSGAGHDAQSMADICPTGMIFVPSKDGISHSPLEFTPWSDCINGANMLLLTILNLQET